METSYLLAWSVPDHAAAPVEQLRSQLFSQTGCISLRALEPIIPIGYVPEPMHQDDLPHDIPRSPKAVWDSLEIKGGALFAVSRHPVTLSDSYLGFSVDGEFPIPPFPGIYIGGSDICEYLQNHPELLEQHAVKAAFIPTRIIQIELTYEVQRTWWKDCLYTVTKLKSLR